MTETALIIGDESPAPTPAPVETAPWRRVSLALFLAGFATFSQLYCVQPLLPVFAAQFHLDAAHASLALSLATGFLAVSILGAGIIAPAVGRKSLMGVALTSAAALNILAAFAPGWGWLLVLRALSGIALGGAPAVGMAYLSEETPAKRLGLAVGLYVAGNAFGGMAGRVITGVLADVAGWRVALGVIGLLGLASAIGFLMLLPPSRNFTPRRGVAVSEHLANWLAPLRQPGPPLLFAVGFLMMGVFVVVYNYAGFRLERAPYSLNQTQAGAIFTVYILGMAASTLAGGLADRLGRTPVLVGGLLVAAAGVAVSVLAPLVAVIVGIALVTVGFFAVHSVASGAAGRMVAPHARSHASTLYMLAYYMGASLLGSAGGRAWTHGGWNQVAVFTGLLLALALAAVLVQAALARRQAKATNPLPKPLHAP